MSIRPGAMPQAVGEIREHESCITIGYTGDQMVGSLADISMVAPSKAHYTDDRPVYEAEVGRLIDQLTSGKPIFLEHAGTRKDEKLLNFPGIAPFCERVDGEYAATVTPRLQRMTGNPDHKVPTLDPALVYLSYVSLRAGGAVVLPTSVGNIVASASPHGLSKMYAVKERPPAKAGVVLTTMDQIPDLAQIPEGWEDYLRHMHSQGILTGSKLARNNEHPLFRAQPDWSREHSMHGNDGTSMFVFLPGPYSDVTARILAAENHLLTASSANKSGEGNNRDIERLHPDIKRGCDFVAWDPEAVDAYVLDEEHESQGVMVDFRPEENGQEKFKIIRFGFMQGPFVTESVAWLRAHPERGIKQITGDIVNVASASNKK